MIWALVLWVGYIEGGPTTLAFYGSKSDCENARQKVEASYRDNGLATGSGQCIGLPSKGLVFPKR